MPRAHRFAATTGAPILEYVGQTVLTATGAETGRSYRFDRPGARLTVDVRDLASLARVPSLRRIIVGR